MASRSEVEVKLSSAKDLKNVNWCHGPVRPYAVVWVDPNNKCSTQVDEDGDTNPNWDETLTIPPPSSPIDDDPTLYIDVVHSGSEPDTKKLIGSARLKLRDIVDDVGYGERATRILQLKRPSGRPQGKVDVKVAVRAPNYRAQDPYGASPYGVPPPAYGAPPPQPAYGAPPPPAAYGVPPPPAAYGAPPPPAAYGAPPPPAAYGAPPPLAYGAPPPPPRDPYYAAAAPPTGYSYNAPPPPYGQPGYGGPVYGQPEEKKKSKFGMGTGLAVGAAAGVLGGLALSGGVGYMKDKITEDVVERVEDDLRYDSDDF